MLKCKECDSVQIAETELVHDHYCKMYAGGITASQLRERLNGVELYDHSDVVIQKLPQHLMVDRVVVGTDEEETRKYNGQYTFFIVDWVYPEVTLRMERVVYDHKTYGTVSVYAVQRITAHDKKYKKTNRKRKPRAKVTKR